MANLKSIYDTNIISLLQRTADRSILLDDLDPNRRNSRIVALQAVERMRSDIAGRSLTVDLESNNITEDLAGTKNESNVTFTLSNTPDLGTLDIFLNGQSLYRVPSSPQAGEYLISGTTITMGLAPKAGDRLWAVYRKA